MYLVKRGVQIETKPIWAFQEVLQKAVPSGGSNLARLGELGGKLLPHFPINRGRGERKIYSTLLVIRESLEINEKNCFREENLSRGASETFAKFLTENVTETFRKRLGLDFFHGNNFSKQIQKREKCLRG